MGTIASTGIGSGLDIQGLVQQLVAAEGQAKSVRLADQEAKLQGKLSAIGSLRSALAELDSAFDDVGDIASFRARRVTLSSPDHLSAVATSDAAPGIYEVEVEQLATPHRLVSSPYAGLDTHVGTGTLTLNVAGQAFSVDLDETTGTVAGIRDAINDADGNTGVLATIVNGVDGARLILTTAKTGAANALVVTQSGGDGGLDALVYDPVNANTQLTELQPAQNARVLIDGFAAESTTNTVSEAVEGLELSVLGTNEPGETTRVAIDLDRSSVKDTVTSLVESYNALLDTVKTATRYDAETQEAGPLLGDASLRNIAWSLRRELNSSLEGVAGPFNTLAELGITTALDGKLSLDATKLDAALNEDSEAVGAAFADPTQGLGVRLEALLKPYLDGGGILDTRTDGINARLEDIEGRREVLEQRLAAYEERLLRQFNALDSLLAEMQSTSGFLQQQLANLPGATFKGNNSD